MSEADQITDPQANARAEAPDAGVSDGPTVAGSAARSGLKGWLITGGLLVALPVVTVGGLLVAQQAHRWLDEGSQGPLPTIQRAPAVEMTPTDENNDEPEPARVAEAETASNNDQAAPASSEPGETAQARADDAEPTAGTRENPDQTQDVVVDAAGEPAEDRIDSAVAEADPQAPTPDAVAQADAADTQTTEHVKPPAPVNPDPAPVAVYETVAERAYARGVVELEPAEDRAFEAQARRSRAFAVEPEPVDAAAHSPLWWARQALAQAAAMEQLKPSRAAEAYTRVAEVAGRQKAAYDAREAVAKLQATGVASDEQLRRGLAALAQAEDHWGVHDVLETIDKPELKAKALAELMVAHVRAGDAESYQIARDQLEAHLIDHQDDAATRHGGWLAHVAAHLKIGDTETALETAERAADGIAWPTRSKALARVATHFAQLGEADAALDTLMRVKHQPTTDHARRDVAGALAASGHMDQAEQLADRVADPALRADAWVALARVKLAGNEREAYRRYARQALMTVRHDLDAYTRILTDMLEAEAQANFFFSATQRMPEINALAARMPQDRAARWRDQIMGTLAVERSRHGQHLDAMRLARHIKSPRAYDRVLARIAQDQARVGLTEAAQAKADALYSPRLREQVLGRIAAHLAGSDTPGRAVAWIERFEPGARLTAQLTAAEALSYGRGSELVRSGR